MDKEGNLRRTMKHVKRTKQTEDDVALKGSKKERKKQTKKQTKKDNDSFGT